MKKTEQFFGQLYSGDNRLSLLDQRYLPRWIVVVIDSLVVVLSIFLVYLILQETPIKFHEVVSVPVQGTIITIVSICFFFVFKTYSGIIRHSTFTDRKILSPVIVL
ncbi:MAG: hypothetical protein AAFP76_17260 [Bacteroidota bacterium]